MLESLRRRYRALACRLGLHPWIPFGANLAGNATYERCPHCHLESLVAPTGRTHYSRAIPRAVR